MPLRYPSSRRSCRATCGLVRRLTRFGPMRRRCDAVPSARPWATPSSSAAPIIAAVPSAGKGSHSHEQCDAQVLFCVNCNGRHSAAYKGCPEMLIRQRANLPRSNSYIPFNVAMQRTRENFKPREQNPVQPAPIPVDVSWSRDRTEVSTSRTACTGPPVSYARVAARRCGGNRGPGGKRCQRNFADQRAEQNSKAGIRKVSCGVAHPSQGVS